MKKKCLMNVLAVAVTCAMLAGCSQQAANTAPTKADEETINTVDTEEVTEEPEEEEEEVKEVSYLLSITSANEDGTYSGCDAEKTEYILTPDAGLPEEQKGLLAVGSTVTVTGSEDSLSDTENGKSFTVTAVQAKEEDTEESRAVEKAAFEKVNGFAVDDSVTGTMYAKQSVNVRKGPSTDYEKSGNLSFAQEINVTGVADTGWYQFDFNGEKGYVSNKYVVTEKPEAKTTTSTASTGGGTSVASTGGSSSGDSIDDIEYPYSAADVDAAIAAGDVSKATEILKANSHALAVAIGEADDSSSSSSSGSSSSSASTEKSTSTSREFVDYMNQKRAEAGLTALSWSDSLASTACERAEEIITDYSHNGMRNCQGENVYKTSTSSVLTH